jgi:hypothetical protein
MPNQKDAPKSTPISKEPLPIGSKVECDPTGSGTAIIGTVVASTLRKLEIKPDDGSENFSVSPKVVTLVKRGTKKDAKAIEKANRPPKVVKVKDPNAVSKSITAGADLSKYTRHADIKTASGRPTYDIGDKTAEVLRGKDLDAVYEVTVKTIAKLTGEKGLTVDELKTKYSKLNPGQQRMNLGNRLRAAFRNSEAGA